MPTKITDWNERTQRSIRAQLVPKALPTDPLPFHAPSNVSLDKESDIHDQIVAECRKRRWYFVHSRTDKRTTTAIGVPDFVIAGFDKVWWIEVKRPNSKPTREQVAVGIALKSLNQNYSVVYSFEEFLNFVDKNG
jgi:hypothetical protein